MSRKHHTKHLARSISNYPDRLADRGISSAQVRMPFISADGRKHNTIDGALRAKSETSSGKR